MIDGPSEWTVKRLVRVRDGNTCQKCGLTNDGCQTTYGRGLHVHRIVPGSRYAVDGCVLLCKRCHGLAHGHKKMNVPEGPFPPPKGTLTAAFRLTPKELADLDAIGMACLPPCC